MQCKKCGFNLLDNEKFCRNCGEPVTNEQQIPVPQPVNQMPQVQPQPMYQQPMYQPQQPMNNGMYNNNMYQNNGMYNQPNKGNNTIFKIFGIIGIVLVGLFIIGLVFGDDDDDSSDSNSNSNITSNEVSNSNTTSNTYSNTNSSTKVVGDSNYGYVTVPQNWTRFYDTTGSSHYYQYSYANVYIVSLTNYDSSKGTAKEYASTFMSKKKSDKSVTDVTGATVTVGKDKKYTAYQVYMYYPADSTYLVTYWFDTGDGKIRYIALEGPKEQIMDYVSIPESFSLTN